MSKRIVVRKLFRLAHEERGSELVEFAITALLLMGLVIGMIEFMLAMYAYHFVSTAAQQGVRFAIVRGNTWSQYETENCETSPPPNFTMAYDCTAQATSTQNDIQNYVQSLATLGINPSKVTVDTSNVWPALTPDGGVCAPPNSPNCLVRVKVSYTFRFLPIEKLSPFTMSATSEGVIAQ
jgi:Flp pilus assembly protein TadG